MIADCDSVRGSLAAYVDGELMGEDRSALEAHVAGCEGCRLALEQEQAVVAAVQSSLPLYQAPAALRQRMERLVTGRAVSRRRARLLAIAAGLLVAAGLGLAGWRRHERVATARTSEFAALAADTHLRYVRGQLPLEVTSDRADVVSGWFSGRVPFPLALPDYPVGPGERKPYRLEGGRLVSFKGDYAASIVYRMDGVPVSLLVTSAATIRPRGGDVVQSGALRFHQESVAGLKVISWTDKGLTYALASDVTLGGARSCLVCHGSPEERSRLRAFPSPLRGGG